MTLLSIAVNYPEGSSARAQGGRGLSHHIEGGLRTGGGGSEDERRSLGGGGQRPQPGNCSFFPKQGEFSSIHVCEHNDPIPLPDNGLLESRRTMDLREIDLGVEIETVRRTRKRVVQAIQSVVGGGGRQRPNRRRNGSMRVRIKNTDLEGKPIRGAGRPVRSPTRRSTRSWPGSTTAPRCSWATPASARAATRRSMRTTARSGPATSSAPTTARSTTPTPCSGGSSFTASPRWTASCSSGLPPGRGETAGSTSSASRVGSSFAAGKWRRSWPHGSIRRPSSHSRETSRTSCVSTVGTGLSLYAPDPAYLDAVLDEERGWHELSIPQ